MYLKNTRDENILTSILVIRYNMLKDDKYSCHNDNDSCHVKEEAEECH